jgi:hypothetical protein
LWPLSRLGQVARGRAASTSCLVGGFDDALGGALGLPGYAGKLLAHVLRATACSTVKIRGSGRHTNSPTATTRSWRPSNDVEVACWPKLTQAYFGRRALQPPSTDLRETVRKDALSSHLQPAGPAALAMTSRGWLARMPSSAARAGQGCGCSSSVCVMRTTMSHHVAHPILPLPLAVK